LDFKNQIKRDQTYLDLVQEHPNQNGLPEFLIDTKLT